MTISQTSSSTTSTAGLAASLRSMAAKVSGKNFSDRKAIVCLFQYGGMDSNDILIPRDGTSQNVAAQYLKRGVLQMPTTSQPVHDNYFMPQAFTSGGKFSYSIVDLFGAGKLKVMANIGTLTQPLDVGSKPFPAAALPLHLYAHDTQQEQWMSAISNEASFPQGWGGHALAKVTSALAPSQIPQGFSVGSSSDLLVGHPQMQLGSDGPIPATGLDAASQSAFKDLMIELCAGTTDHVFALDYGERFMKAADAANALHGQIEMLPTLPGTELGNQFLSGSFKSIVRTMLATQNDPGHKRQIFFVGYGGWDTHANQSLQSGFSKLSSAMGYFQRLLELNGLDEQVVTFTASDFNRTFLPNGNGGSDHAWGGQTMVMSSDKIIGGADPIIGQMHDFEVGGTYDVEEGLADPRGRWIPTTGVVQLAATLAQWFGVEPADMPAVFPTLANFAGPNGHTGLLPLFNSFSAMKTGQRGLAPVASPKVDI